MCIPENNFFGLRFTTISDEDIPAILKQSIIYNKQTVVYGYSLGSVRIMRQMPIMYKMGNTIADINLIDGRGVYFLGKLFGNKLGKDISIPEFCFKLLDHANACGASLLLLGTTRILNLQAKNNIQNKYPNINVLDGVDGFFKKHEEDSVVKKISYQKPNIILVGISSPKKEEFVEKYLKQINANLIVHCGGVIDIIAGDKTKTPRILKRAGLASIWRFVQEPKRLYKYFFPFWGFFIFNLVPSLLWGYLKHGKNFSIPKYYKIVP